MLATSEDDTKSLLSLIKVCLEYVLMYNNIIYSLCNLVSIVQYCIGIAFFIWICFVVGVRCSIAYAWSEERKF